MSKSITLPDGVTVRLATRADVPAIVAIYNHAVLHTTASYDLEPVSVDSRLAWYDHKVADGWPVLVAEEGGEITGWATYGPFREKPGYRFTAEHSVYVREDCRGRGVGRTLLRALIALARERGLRTLVGGVDADNAGSLAFHEGLGFARVAHFRHVGHKFGRWLDLVFLQLDLESPAPATPAGTEAPASA
ncbi:phosphinothricin acetyltransferase [Deinococcus metalli]|uniref:Phosphinothricin acetyltransferase n=1 Tax=Deinococcus metalli TaxID=1141878 RepID=A0A7W8KBQ5_9DEIO|nr:GNAT family N-acetyltransferase [Deinococcus metalli]MBB5375249.1 phosphinothricin acetyltransferase [Deinococcus metalli]GHF30660.1 phosphinothricin acetyltransferase [Deinococcus metalli]